MPTIKSPSQTKSPKIKPQNIPPQTLDERTISIEGFRYIRDDVTMTVFVQDMTGIPANAPLVTQWEEHLRRLGYHLYRIEVEPPTEAPASKPKE